MSPINLFLSAGFGGAYGAYLLNKQVPSLRVIVVERSGRVGGRLHSEDSDGLGGNDDEANKDELGGMRIFPSAGMDKVRQSSIRTTTTCNRMYAVPVQHIRAYRTLFNSLSLSDITLSPILISSFQRWLS